MVWSWKRDDRRYMAVASVNYSFKDKLDFTNADSIMKQYHLYHEIQLDGKDLHFFGWNIGTADGKLWFRVQKKTSYCIPSKSTICVGLSISIQARDFHINHIENTKYNLDMLRKWKQSNES